MDELKDLFPPWLPPWLSVALVGAITAGWSHVKQTARILFSKMVEEVTTDADLAAELMQTFGSTSKIQRSGIRGYMVLNRYHRGLRRQTWILSRWLQKDTTIMFWIKVDGSSWLRPVIVARKNDGSQMVFRFIRGTVNFEKILQNIVDSVNNKKEGRYRLVKVVGGRDVIQDQHGNGGPQNRQVTTRSDNNTFTQNPATAFYINVTQDMIGDPIHSGGPDDLYQSEPIKQVIDDARRWAGKRDWYMSRGIPWRRGYLMFGKPGTGKTSTARAIAIDLDFPVFSLDLASMTNADLIGAFQSARESAPAMVVLEDIDAVYTKRSANNITHHGPPSFDALLNQIQGVENNDGLLVFVTTNNIAVVDEALGGPSGDTWVEGQMSSRPGRIDVVVRTPDTIDERGRREIANKMLPAHMVTKVIEAGEGKTPAQFHELVIQSSWEIAGENDD